MSIVDAQIRTISCNACDKTVTFDQRFQAKAVEENEWLKSSRVVQTGDGRNFVYCSDTCEVVGVGAGTHNIPEQKKVVEVPSTSASEAIRLAAAAAAAAEAGTKALKQGNPAKLHVV